MRDQHPGVPYTPAEIADAAIACYHAGAAIAHIHVRDPASGRPSSRLDYFAEVLERIRAAGEMLVNLTTSGLDITTGDLTARRLEVVGLRPDLCSLDVGSLNFRDRVFANPPDFGEKAAAAMAAAGVKPEIEVFDVGHIAQAEHLLRRGLIAPPPLFQLCMGVPWGIPATPENLIFMHSKLPAGAIWSVLGVGRAQLPMITMGILLGGHVRVGFEDNLYLRQGELAASNADFVRQAAGLAAQLQRPLATPAQARALLDGSLIPGG